MTITRTFILAALTFGIFAAAYSTSAAQEDATLELHWRDCATAPADDASWFDHCHDGPFRISASEGAPATFTNSESGEEFTGELNGNGDMTISVPAGTYTFQQPPAHDAETMGLICSPLDEQGNTGDPIADPDNIAIADGEHIVCDFYAVWGEGGAGVEEIGTDDPQGIIEFRWRACEEASDDEEWHEDCFEQESDNALDPQEGRRITVNNAETNQPWSGELDENGNVLLIITPGEYDLPKMTGGFVTEDFLYCSEANEAGTAKEMDIETDPLMVEDESHVICDYYYVAE